MSDNLPGGLPEGGGGGVRWNCEGNFAVATGGTQTLASTFTTNPQISLPDGWILFALFVVSTSQVLGGANLVQLGNAAPIAMPFDFVWTLDKEALPLLITRDLRFFSLTEVAWFAATMGRDPEQL